MGKITIVLPDDVELRLRQQCLRKGDMSRIIETALQRYWQGRDEAKQ